MLGWPKSVFSKAVLQAIGANPAKGIRWTSAAYSPLWFSSPSQTRRKYQGLQNSAERH